MGMRIGAEMLKNHVTLIRCGRGEEKTWSLDEALDDVLYFLEWEFPEKVPDTLTHKKGESR